MMTFKEYIMENLWGDIQWQGRKPSDGQGGEFPNPSHGGSGGAAGGGMGAMGGGAPAPGGAPENTNKPLGMMKKLMKKKMKK